MYAASNFSDKFLMYDYKSTEVGKRCGRPRPGRRCRLPTGALVSAVSIGPIPWGMAIDPVTHAVFVTNSFDANLYVIDGSDDASAGTLVEKVPAGDEGVAVDPAPGVVFVARSNGNIAEVDESGDADNGTVIRTFLAPGPNYQIAIDPTTHNLFMAGGYITVGQVTEVTGAETP
jgi:DNA-binding beta-propeller fold protein YncE